MVLATKYKNINPFVKFVAVLLSAALMCGAAVCALHLAASLEYTGNVKSLFGYETKEGLAECDPLVNAFSDNINRIGRATYIQDEESIKMSLLSQKEDFVNSTLEQFKKGQASYKSAINTADDYDEEEGVTETTLASYSDEPFDFAYTFSLPGGMSAELSSYDFIHSDGLEYHLDYVADDEDSAKQKLESIFNNYVESKAYLSDNMDIEKYEEFMKSDLRYYVKNRNTGIVLTNVTAEEAQQTLQQKYGLIYVNHQVKTTNGLSGVLDRYYSATENQWVLSDYDCDYYFYIDTDMSKADAGRNSLVRIISDYNKAKTYNVKLNIIGAVIMFVLAIALAVWYFVNAGTRGENGKIKLSFIDRVPSDLHIALSCGLVALGLFGLFQILDTAEFFFTYDLEQHMLLYLLLAAVAIIWLLFIEMLSSFIRVCKSEKPLYKNLLVFYCGKYLIYYP